MGTIPATSWSATNRATSGSTGAATTGDGQRVPDLALRGGELPGGPSRGARGRRGREPGPRARDGGQGVRGPAGGAGSPPGPGGRDPGAPQADDRAVQRPAQLEFVAAL